MKGLYPSKCLFRIQRFRVSKSLERGAISSGEPERDGLPWPRFFREVSPEKRPDPKTTRDLVPSNSPKEQPEVSSAVEWHTGLRPHLRQSIYFQRHWGKQSTWEGTLCHLHCMQTSSPPLWLTSAKLGWQPKGPTSIP